MAKKSKMKRMQKKPNTFAGNILRTVSLVGGIITFIGTIIGIIAYFDYLKDKQLSAQIGVIIPPTSAEIKYLSVGSSRFVIDTVDGVFLKDGNAPVLSMQIRNGNLYVSTTIRNKAGEISAELKDNEWKLNKNNEFDRNYSKNALEVRDCEGRITLQVVHFGDTVHLAGLFYCSNGRSFIILPKTCGDGAIIEFQPPQKEITHSIVPIFEYPSDLHFGSCPGIDALAKTIIHGTAVDYHVDQSIDICTFAPQQ